VDSLNVLDADFLRREECNAFIGKCVCITNKVFELFIALEDIDFAIVQCEIIIISQAHFNILPSNFITDGTIVKIL
jgi:hypothetical protein